MPSPEKFMKSLERFDVSKDIISQINSGFKDITDKSPQEKESGFFQKCGGHYDGERFLCACSNFNRFKFDYSVSKNYCFCCAGHFNTNS